MTQFGRWIVVGICLFAIRPEAAVSEVINGQMDDFQGGTTQGWSSGANNPNPNPVSHLSDGGPAGVGDGFLLVTSTGAFGAGGKLVAFNTSQWAGDYLTAGVESIVADLNNLGATALDIRLLLEGPGGKFVSTAGVSLVAGSGWQPATFAIGPGDLTGGFNLGATLGGVTRLRIVHNPVPDVTPPQIVATLGVDNINAIPEPGTLTLLSALFLSVMFGSAWKAKRRRFLCLVIITVSVTMTAANSAARAEFPTIRLEPITTGQLVAPVGLTNAADGSDRLFVIDQRGKIQIIQNGSLLPVPLLDIETKLVDQRDRFDERGLLGLAFHPEFGVTGAPGEDKFYVYYSADSPDSPGPLDDPVEHQSVVAEYRVESAGSNVADPASERILLTFNQPQWNHDAGQLAFGPDGKLYISTGDGGGGGDDNPGHTGAGEPVVFGNAQDRTNLLGNVLRIDVDGDNGPGGQYGIPADNPFFGEGGGVREEIFAYGLRNPWRFSFDDGPGGSGALFLADVGQGDIEEVNVILSGGNYGWRIREGSSDFDPNVVPNPNVTLIDPIAEYAHPGVGNGLPEVGLATVGGFVYRGSEFPELVGKYVFADWGNGFTPPGNGTLLGLEEASPGVFDFSVLDVQGGNPIGLFITAFGEDEAGELYVVAKSALDPGLDPNSGGPGGVIFKITPVPEPASAALLAAGLLSLLVFSFRRRQVRSTKPD